MKKHFVIFTLLALVTATCFLCKKPKAPGLTQDPIAALGHGLMVGQDGKPLQLTAAFIEQMQDYYLRYIGDDKLQMGEGSDYDAGRAKEVKQFIYDEVDDQILANALYLDYLLEHKKPGENGRYPIINNALRWYYVHNIQKEKILPGADKLWYKGLSKETADRLKPQGVIAAEYTNSYTGHYCDECEAAGVPVPRNMFGPEWQSLGEFDGDEFLDIGTPELLIKVSTNPPGFCLALPRYVDDVSTAFGIVCMSTVNSKVCFFDNTGGGGFKKDEVIDFRTSFLGGQDLVAAGLGGVCSDCHAGENPFVVHPDLEPFIRFKNIVGNTMPPQWYIPIIPVSWPANPGPSYVLDGIPEGKHCNSCHTKSGAGRFPRVELLPQYCKEVLTNAVDEGSADGTMPPGDEDIDDYAAHRDALLNYCCLSAITGEVKDDIVPPSDNHSFISPPTVVGPLYACATGVTVKGVVLDAKVDLMIDGSIIATIPYARNPSQVNFDNLPPLTKGQRVTAIQTFGNATSNSSQQVIVKNVREDYPNGLPAPTIDPVVYECARLIAIKHLRGATVTIYTDGANPKTFNTAGDYTTFEPSGAPFTKGMKFTAELSFCTEKSPLSKKVLAKQAPATLAPPTYALNQPYQNQELIDIYKITEGATVSLKVNQVPWTGSFSTPVNWFDNYDLKTNMGRSMRLGDFLELNQALCTQQSPWTTPGSETKNCELIPAARIDIPRAGQTYVTVNDQVPGSRVAIYDNGGNEIGDGSGTLVQLSRSLVANEKLQVVQRLGWCTSRYVFVINVVN